MTQKEFPTKHISCDICEEDNTKLLFKKEAMGIIFNYVQCKNCGLVYVDPMPDLKPEELERYYSTEYYSEDLESLKRGEIDVKNPEDPRMKANNYQLKAIERYIKRGKLIDIGCGPGFFLKAAKDLGWDVYGLEPSKRAADYAEKEFGINVYCGDFKSLKLQNGVFDAAVLRHVLEHTTDPIELLVEVERILKKDGLIVVQVPNTDTITRRVRNAYYRLLFKKYWGGNLDPPIHNYDFSPNTLKMAVTKAGFSTVECFTVPFGDKLYWPTDPPLLEKKFPKKPLLKLIRFLERITGKNRIIVLYAKNVDDVPIMNRDNQLSGPMRIFGIDAPRRHVYCNLCGGDNANLLVVEDGFSFVKCRECGLVYENPRPKIDELNKHYEEKYLDPEMEVGEVDSITYNQIQKEELYKKEIKYLTSVLPKGKLLDVGSGFGIFLNVASTYGFAAVGVEPSKRGSEWARSKYGLDITTGTLEEANFPDEYFDVVTMFDVLEHADDPGGLLKDVHRILKKDGLLYIQVPNVAYLYPKYKFFRRIGIKRGYFDPKHLTYFSPDTIRALLEKNGYTNIEIFNPGPFRDSRFIKNLKLRFLFVVSNFLYHLSNKRFIYGEIGVHARKHS